MSRTIRLLLLPGACALAGAAPAQGLPDAGSMLRQVVPPHAPPPARAGDAALPAAPALPAPQEANGPSLRVQGFRITGATVFTEPELLAVVQEGVGRELDLAGLEALADRMSRFYRSHGYTVARAYLPAQDIRDGIVRIAVVEGRFGAITTEGAAPPNLPLGALATGEVVTDEALERALLLSADVPGIRVRSTLRPGVAVGTSDFVVDVEPGERIAASVEADNYGSRSTGRSRLGGTLLVNNPAGLGDQAALRGVWSGEGLAYGRASYQLPVDRQGTQVGAALSSLRYELQEEFAVLEAHGTARVASLFATHPVLRSRAANLGVQLTYDAKRLQDRIDAAGAGNDRRIDGVTATLAGDRSDLWGAGGAWLLNVALTAGELRLDDPAARATDQLTARTEGRYGKAAWSLVRQQQVRPGSVLLVSYSGQYARRNLDSSEKLPLGGMGGVRAYPQGEWPSDRAQLLTIEWRQALAPGWQGIAFVDAARGRANADPWPGADAGHRSLGGAGLGLVWAQPRGGSVRLVYAHPLGNAPATAEPDQDGRVWLQAAWTF